ncbi:MAG: hypothetical protein JWQ28_470, partial [Pedobacter sp.]|nr:hypothetical protein [Pedobacter sp.]
DLSDKVERLISNERAHDMRYTKLAKQISQLQERMESMEKILNQLGEAKKA